MIQSLCAEKLLRFNCISVSLLHRKMATTESAESRYIGADVPEDLHNRVRIQAAKEDKSMAELVREILDENVEHL